MCTVYRPPSSSYDFWENFQTSIDLAKATSIKPMIITGDLNADPNTVSGTKLRELADINGLSILINEPTRITQSSSSILDQFLTNSPNLVKSVKIDPPLANMNNDHCTVSVCLYFRIKT